jgi:1-acyl-sn-glycerol-3-phosphate acyltransferase
MTMSYATALPDVEDGPKSGIRPCEQHVPEVRADVVRRSHRILSRVMRSYFRSEVRGAERLPSSQSIIVTHHDGGVLPLNGIAFGVAWYDQFGFDRPLYVLTHDLLHSVCGPFSRLLADSGLMRADRKAMDAVLSTGQSVLIFPGAARESFRSFWDRKNIDLGGRKGFVAQAIRWGLPITPVVSAGSHETLVVLSGGHKLAKKIGLPKLVRSADVLPLLAGLPWGVWALPFLPQIPLPAKITTEVMEPVNLSEALGRNLRPSDADNPEIVQSGFDLIIERMRNRLSELYDERRYPILG